MTYPELDDVTAKLAAVRYEARVKATRALRDMEQALRAALGKERLLGLPNLASSKNPWRGARVRGQTAKRLPTQYFGHGGGWSKPVLCVSEYGRLVMARRSRSGDVNTTNAQDDELLAEDAQHLAELLPTIIAEHLTRASARHEQFAKLQALSERITHSLKEDDHE